MPSRDDLTALFDRVTEHCAKPSDLARLGRSTRGRADGRTVQVGGYNVNLRSGRDIHIGGRLYRGGDAGSARAEADDRTLSGRFRAVSRHAAGLTTSTPATGEM